jgi:hypothetical protein
MGFVFGDHDLGTFTKIYFTSSHPVKQSHKGGHDDFT